MSKYRRKPEAIDAIPFDPHKSWPAGMVSWKEAGYQPRDMSWGYIETPEGKKHVMVGDWIITNEAGEHDLCKPGVFVATYEPVEITERESATVKFEYQGKVYEGVVYEVKQ